MGKPIHAASSPPARLQDGALAATIAAAVSAYATTLLTFKLFPATNALNTHMSYWSSVALDVIGFHNEKSAIYQNWLQQQNEFMYPKLLIIATVATVAAAWAGWQFGKPISNLKITDGYEVAEGSDALKKLKKMHNWFQKKGLKFGSFHLTFDKETKHFLLAGGTGSGKTVTLENLLKSAVARGDRVLLIDFKDLTEVFPATLNKDLLLLDPTDARSVPWSIGKDILNVQHAKDFAAEIVQETSDKLWSDSARALVVACILSCQKELSKSWGFTDLAERLQLSREDLLALVEKHYPRAANYIKEPGKLADSVMVGIPANCDVIFDLAELYKDRKNGISIRNWVRNPSTKYRNIILKTSTEYAQITSAFNRAILSQVKANISALPKAKAHVNPLWLIVDEFPQLGRIDWKTFLEVGRSKGLRCVMCIQSASQLIEIYGQHISDSWIDSIGTKIFGVQDGAGAEWVEGLAGEISGEKLNISNTEGGGNAYSYSEFRKQAFSANRVKNELGVQKNGVRMLIHGLTKNGDVVVDFGFVSLKARRVGHVLHKLFEQKEAISVIKKYEVMEHENEIVAAPNLLPALPAAQAAVTSIERSEENEMLEMFNIYEEPVIVDEKNNDESVEEIAKEAAVDALEMIVGVHGIGLAVEALEFAEEFENTDNENEITVENIVSETSKKKRKRLSARDAVELSK